MKCRNMLFKKIKYGIVILLIMLMTIKVPVLATEGIVEGEPTQDPEVPAESSAYIEMKVKTQKVGSANQVLVECWATELTNLEGIDIVFTYKNGVLEPSNIDGNVDLEANNENGELINLASIKYDKNPDRDYPTTGTLTEAGEKFLDDSKKVLQNSFKFADNYKDILDIDRFAYREPGTDNEMLQFVLTKKDLNSIIDIQGKELIGTFSFRQTEGTTVEAGVFDTKVITVICQDASDPSGISIDSRDALENNEDCTEIVEFTYEQHGSISGKIDIKIENGSKYFPTKNIVTIKVYNKQDVEGIDWLLTGKNYMNMRSTLPDPVAQHTTTEQENGSFSIDSVTFGEYVVLIDKEYFADFIITNVVVSAENKDVNLSDTEELSSINLMPGDVNKDGKINGSDTTAYNKDLNNGKLINLDDAIDSKGNMNTGTDTRIFKKILNLYGKLSKTQTIKKVYNLQGGEYEK